MEGGGKMKIELRWFKSVDDGDYKLQYREVYVVSLVYHFENWQEVPFVLEGCEEKEKAT